MINQSQDITIHQFAKKHVISLPKEASIAEAIRLMYLNRIRHIPIISRTEVIGVVNTETIIDYICTDHNLVDFNLNVAEILSTEYRVVAPDFPLFEVVEIISQNPTRAVIVEEHNTLTGIFTEIDILDTEFLWHNFSDQPVFVDDQLGHEIIVDHINTAEKSILDNLRITRNLGQSYIMLSEDHDIIRGVIDLFSIIHHLYFTTYRQGKKINDVLNQPLYTIFPASAMWYREPIFLSKIRSDMFINDLYYALIMDKANQARRIISSLDIIAYLVEHSDYFDDERINQV